MPMTRNHQATVPAGLRYAKRGVRQFLFPVLLSFGAIAASLLILQFAPAPFFWLLLTWAAALWAAIFGVRGSWPRAILFNLGIVACVVAGVEAYMLTHEYTPRIFSPGFMVPDDALGWGPAKGMQAKAMEAASVGLFHRPVGKISDTMYTIDSNGLRIAPPYRSDDLAGSVLFFGCSYTFGIGLKDDETLPYQVGVQSDGRYRTFNFAFVAYGPSQMLAAIETGRVSGVVDTTPGYAYYIAIPHHVWRAAGRVDWIHHQPRYVLETDGTLHRAGYFEGRKSLARELSFGWLIEGQLNWIEGQLNKAAIWRRLLMKDSRITDDDIRLYLAMIGRTQELITTQYPGIQFRIILWPGQGGSVAQRSTYEKIRDGFLRMGIPVDFVEDILPGYNTDREKFQLSSMDTHQNALANRLLAQYVVSKLAH
ncbi:MAG: hypothetical protein ABSH41_23005 [Syntrophobacteraceae bacterium]